MREYMYQYKLFSPVERRITFVLICGRILSMYVIGM